jgi:hypothetical protein
MGADATERGAMMILFDQVVKGDGTIPIAPDVTVLTMCFRDE